MIKLEQQRPFGYSCINRRRPFAKLRKPGDGEKNNFLMVSDNQATIHSSGSGDYLRMSHRERLTPLPHCSLPVSRH
jgi:hypothetical protein